MIESPVIIIGTQRSGTTWLGSLISKLPEFAYWVEPRQVWVYGNSRRPDDVLTKEHVSERIQDYINRRFSEYTQRLGKTRFCEKTPSNCLRVSFIHNIFPNAKFIFLIRDGRAVFRSTREMHKTGIGWDRVLQRLQELSWRDIPAYIDRIPWMFQKILGRPLTFWGPRPVGWKEWIGHYSSNVILAKQWAACIDAANQSFENVPENQKLIVRYEDIFVKSETCSQIESVLDFLGVSDPSPAMDFFHATADVTRSFNWRSELSPNLLQEIRPHMESTLNSIGYNW